MSFPVLEAIRVSRTQVWDVETLSWIDQTSRPSALTPSAPASESVGTSSAEALASNSTRGGLTLINLGAGNISLGLNGATAVLNSGITLQPGATWTMTAETFTTGAINAIAEIAASVLSIQEFEIS